MTKIIITDGQTDAILDRINQEDVIDNDHERDKSLMLETFKFIAFADRRYSEYLTDRNRVVIPGEDGEYREFVIKLADRYRDDNGINLIEVTALASFQELIGAKIIRPGTTDAQSAEAHAREILAGTEVEVGEVAYTGVRTITRENYTDPFSALKSLATEFELELDFRVEVDTNRITKRYADLVERIGEWRGRYAEFGKDLLGIRRIEDTSEIVTALLCLGPVREDGTRLEVFVEDRDALARWGRRGQHIVAIYEPQSEDLDMTEERLITLGQIELKKRINAIVDYEIDVVDLEHVPGMEHKKIRFGDTKGIKDSAFNPPLFVEARIYKQNRNIFNPSSKKVVLGDYIEYTVEEIRDNWNAIREEIDRKVKEAEKRAKLIATIGDIRFTIISYKEPLKAQKSSIDSQYTSLVNNLDLDTSIRNNLATVKATYDNAYGNLVSSIDSTVEKEELTENDLQYVNRQYASYESGMAELTELFELATDAIAKKKADDAEDGANRYTDEHLVDINLILDRAQEEIDQAIIDIGEAERRINEADQRIGEAIDELDSLEERLNQIDRDKVNIVDYNAKINEITNDIATKVDGEWVDGRLRVAIDDLEIGGRNLIIRHNEIVGQNINTSGVLERTPGNSVIRDFIPVKPGEKLVFSQIKSVPDSGVTTNYFRYAFYDEPINNSSHVVKRSSNNSSVFYETVPNGANWLRVSYFTDNQIKVEKGNKATDWTPAPEDIFADIDLKADADNVYIKSQIDNMFDNVVSYTVYQADLEGIVSQFDSIETRLYQNTQAIGAKVEQTVYDADIGRIDNRITQWELTVDGIEQRVSNLRYDFDHMEIGGRNLYQNSKGPFILEPKNTGQSSDNYNYYRFYCEMELNETYTISADIEITHGDFDKVTVYPYPGGKASAIPIPSNGRIKHTFVKTSETIDSVLIYAGLAGSTRGQGIIIRNVKLELGNKATDWTPAPEDQIEYTETRIRQLADEIDLSYVKNNEVISRINLSNEGVRIDGKLLEINGDTLIRGNLAANNATFLGMTTRDMTAINATIQNSTITGTLTANNATFLQGTFDRATIIDATIQDAVITGRLNGATGTFAGEVRSGTPGNPSAVINNGLIESFSGKDYNANGIIIDSGSIRMGTWYGGDFTEDVRFNSNYIEASGVFHINATELRLGSQGIFAFDGAGSIDNAGGSIRWRQSNIHYIIQNTVGTVSFYKDGSQMAYFTTVDSPNHGFFRMGTVGLKFLNESLVQLQVRNASDTAYAPLVALSVTETSSEKYKTNIEKYEGSALELINSSVIYQYEKGGKQEIGLILERETPIEVVEGQGVRPYMLGSLAWKAIQEVDKKITSIIDEINWLKTENQYLKNEIIKLKEKVA